MNRHWQWFLTICLTVLLVVTQLQPTLAGFGFGGFQIPASPGDLINIGKDSGEKAAFVEIGKALGLKAPVHLDAHHAFPQAEEPRNFKPVQLRVEDISDLNAKLPPGDYVMNIIAYCTNYSIHRPGMGIPYTIAPAEGTKIKAIANLTLRGELAHTDRGTLQNISSTIQAGLPLSQWRDEYKTVAHQLIPDFEGDLRGDLIDEYQGEYERVRHTIPVNLPNFDDGVSKLPLGREILNIKKARAVLTDRSISAQEVGDHLYQATGDGSPQTLTPSHPKPSPWVKVRENVIARATVINGRAGDGSSGINKLEFRILRKKSAIKKQLKYTVSSSKGDGQVLALFNGDPNAPIEVPTYRPIEIETGIGVLETETAVEAAAESTSLVEIYYGTQLIPVVGEVIDAGLIIYGVILAVQALTVTPEIEKENEKENNKKCLPCNPVPFGGLAYDYHSTENGSKPHDGMLQHTHHFKMNQSPPSRGCICGWNRNFIKPTPGFSPLPGAVPVQPASGGGVAS